MDTDLLYGLDAIAAHLSAPGKAMTYRQAQHLHESGAIPTFKLGQTVCARRSALAKHFAELERAARHA